MDRYYTLIASLPYLGQFEKGSELPISRLGLDKRLTMILEEDREQLECIESLYFTDFDFWVNRADREIVHYWNDKISQIRSECMRQRIQYHFELQTFLAAFRYRNAGSGNAGQFAGAGRWGGFIKRHWHEPDFAIGDFHPGWQSLAKLIKRGDVGRVDQELKRLLWQDLAFYGQQSGFSLDAVACYVLRWRLLSSYLHQNADKSVNHFNQLANKLLEKAELEGVNT